MAFGKPTGGVDAEIAAEQKRQEAIKKQQNLELQRKQISALRQAASGFGGGIAPTSLLGGGQNTLG